MPSHPLARLTPISRYRLIRLHIEEELPLKAPAAQSAFNLLSAYKWLARFLDGGSSALADRKLRRIAKPSRRTDPASGG